MKGIHHLNVETKVGFRSIKRREVPNRSQEARNVIPNLFIFPCIQPIMQALRKPLASLL